MVSTEYVNFGGWPKCVRLSNGTIEIVVTTDFGPRIVSAGFVGGQNMLHLSSRDLGQLGGEKWRFIGGHRLWHAPEAMPRTYAPDNDPVEVEEHAGTTSFHQRVEPTTGIRKSISITMGEGATVRVRHTLKNEGPWPIRFAPWALSVMAPGGFFIAPQEEFRAHPTTLLPARPLVLWHYTNMADPRWTWGRRYIFLRQDPTIAGPQKAGLLNKQGWVAYSLRGDVVLHSVPFDPRAEYTDHGCNVETYVDKGFLEVETLGAYTEVNPGESVAHDVHWLFGRLDLTPDETVVENALGPLVAELNAISGRAEG
jgi:hypothetical protein